jgi:hypothetical protein
MRVTVIVWGWSKPHMMMAWLSVVHKMKDVRHVMVEYYFMHEK